MIHLSWVGNKKLTIVENSCRAFKKETYSTTL